MDLLKRKLPNDGILHQTVIASKMDAAVMDHKGRVETFKDAFLKTLMNVKRPFREKFGAQHDPIPVSALLASAAYKMECGAPLLPEEEHCLNNLKEFSGAPRKVEELRRTSNIQAARQELETSRVRKDEIKRSHQIELICGKNGELRECLQDLEQAAIADKKTLTSVDLENLQRDMAALKKSMDNIRKQLTNLFNQAETELKASMVDLKLRIVKNIDNFRLLSINTEVREEDRSYSTGMLFWKKTHHRTVSITEYHVDTADVINTLRKYSIKTQDDINNAYKDILPLEQLKGEVKRLVLDAFNKARVEFNEQTVLQPLKTSLGKLTVPPFHYDIESQTDLLVENFGDCTHNEDISKLKTAQEKILDEVCKETQKRLDHQKSTIIKELHIHGDSFIDNILSSVTGNLEKLSKQLNDKNKCLAGYEAAAQTVRTCRSNLSKQEF
jgi:flagellin-like hook-associated protein FlgL